MIKTFDRLQADPVFIAWQKANADHTLAHCFIMMQKAVKPVWQFGFYLPSSDKIMTFVVDEKVEQNEISEAFKEPDTKIKLLDLDLVLINFEGAVQVAEMVGATLAKNEPITTTIAILQNHQEHGTIWNITFVTMAFKSVNVKIDAKTGDVLAKSAESLLNLGTPLPKEDEE